MPKSIIYYFALFFPVALRLLLLNTPFVDWLAAHQHGQSAAWLGDLRANARFLQLAGGWALPVFAIACFGYWISLEDGENVPAQFLLLPIAYVPFTVIGDVFATGAFDLNVLYANALVVIPVGYLYILPWAVLAYILSEMDLVA